MEIVLGQVSGKEGSVSCIPPSTNSGGVGNTTFDLGKVYNAESLQFVVAYS